MRGGSCCSFSYLSTFTPSSFRSASFISSSFSVAPVDLRLSTSIQFALTLQIAPSSSSQLRFRSSRASPPASSELARFALRPIQFISLRLPPAPRPSSDFAQVEPAPPASSELARFALRPIQFISLRLPPAPRPSSDFAQVEPALLPLPNWLALRFGRSSSSRSDCSQLLVPAPISLQADPALSTPPSIQLAPSSSVACS